MGKETGGARYRGPRNAMCFFLSCSIVINTVKEDQHITYEGGDERYANYLYFQGDECFSSYHLCASFSWAV